MGDGHCVMVSVVLWEHDLNHRGRPCCPRITGTRRNLVSPRTEPNKANADGCHGL